ncbi:MAG: Nramp family divalent metal transporter [Candidatus Latescibacteria bacterium]|nr:Nramp family divalent metal transporter [Candidatus Latescibacterota bacterium]
MNTGRTGVFGRIGLILAAVGPGLFMIGYNIGTGSITTMASAGSRYGMSLIWTLVLSCVFTFVMLVAYSRFTLVSGSTSMAAYRKYLPFGKWIALYTVFVLTLGELASLAGIMGIVTDLIREWTKILFGGEGMSMLVSATVIIAGCFYFLWVGKYSRFETFLTSLVVVMGLSFLISMFMVVPDPKDLVAGLVPRIPNEPNAFLIIAGMAGTTCSAMVFVMRSIVVAEKGWSAADLRREKFDAFVSVSMMFLLSAAVMACAAGTLYKMGIPVERAVDMVRTLEPFAGRFAISIFVVGVIGAGISTLFPIVLVLPWLISDFTGGERNVRSAMYRILGGLGLLIGFTVPLFGGRPVWIMIASNAFQATILPVITLAIIVLVNRKSIMGRHAAGAWLNAGMWATFVFAVVTAFTAVVGIAGTLADML